MKYPARKRLLYTAGGLPLLAGVVLLAAYLFYSRSLASWIEEGLQDLEPYPHVLMRDGECSHDVQENPKDRALVRHTAEGREVVEMTRSEFRRAFLSQRRWVKVMLVTARPGGEESALRLKLLHQLERKQGEEWEVRSVEELALP